MVDSSLVAHLDNPRRQEMRSICLAVVVGILAAAGCGGGNAGVKTETKAGENASTEFTVALKKLKAVTTVGGNQQEFRTSLQGLAAATDGSERADKIIGLYKESLELWGLMEDPAAVNFTGTGGEFKGDIAIGIKDGSVAENAGYSTAQKNFLNTVLDFMKTHPELVTIEKSTSYGLDSRWIIQGDTVQQLWAKAEKM
jgi:hypothetical protein